MHRADPLVSVSLEESGEHVVSAAGEIHLETCIKDLKERFARVELVVSPPLASSTDIVAVLDAYRAIRAQGLSFPADKAAVMRLLAPRFTKGEMRRVYGALAAAAD